MKMNTIATTDNTCAASAPDGFWESGWSRSMEENSLRESILRPEIEKTTKPSSSRTNRCCQPAQRIAGIERPGDAGETKWGFAELHIANQAFLNV